MARLTAGLGVGALCCVSFLSGCNDDEEPVKPGIAPVTVGVNIALTGALGAFGQAEQESTKVAAHILNSYGGVAGQPVSFSIVDDATNTEESTKALQGFIDTGLPAVIGPTGSGQAAAIQPLAAENKVLLISPSASTPVTRETEADPPADRYFFRTAASHALQAKALAIRVAAGFEGGGGGGNGGAGGGGGGGGGVPGCNSVVLIHADDAYGGPIADGFEAQFGRSGVVGRIAVPVDVKADYEAEVNQMIEAVPLADCQVIITFPGPAIGYMKSFKDVIASDTSRPWADFVSVGSNGLFSSAFLVDGREDPADPSSPTIGEGMYIMNLDLNPVSTEYTEFKNLFTNHFPLEDSETDLAGYTANQFDAIVLLALAMEAARTTTDSRKIRDALFEVSRGGTAYSPARISEALEAVRRGDDVDYNGASGPVDFDEYGEVVAGYVVYKIVEGAFSSIPGDKVDLERLQQ